MLNGKYFTHRFLGQHFDLDLLVNIFSGIACRPISICKIVLVAKRTIHVLIYDDQNKKLLTVTEPTLIMCGVTRYKKKVSSLAGMAVTTTKLEEKSK